MDQLSQRNIIRRSWLADVDPKRKFPFEEFVVDWIRTFIILLTFALFA